MRLLWKTNLALAVWLICGETAKIQLKYEYCATPQGAADEVCAGVEGLGDMITTDSSPFPLTQQGPDTNGQAVSIFGRPSTLQSRETFRGARASCIPTPQIPRKRERQQTIPQLLREAATRHGVDPERVLRLAWKESRFKDTIREEANGSLSCGPLQGNSDSFPGICEAAIAEKIDAPVRYLAKLIREHGAEAEVWFRFGKGRR